MRKKDEPRALGPYDKGNGSWYIVVLEPRPTGSRGDDGKAIKRKREAQVFDNKPAAEKRLAAINAVNEGKAKALLSKAIERYLKDGKERGLKPRSLDTARERLALFFGKAPTIALLSVTPKCSASRYEELRAEDSGVSVATHRHTLAEVKRFLKWCVEEKFLASNPAEAVKPKGQLRLSEARTFISVGEELLAVIELPDPVSALAEYGVRPPTWVSDGGQLPEYRAIVRSGVVSVFAALYLAMSASEIASRVVRDLDDEGRLLHIEGELKTDNRERVLEVPERLRKHLLSLAKGKSPGEQLFAGSSRKTVHYWAKRLSAIAGVPSVTAHGLRGSFASIARAQGAATAIVSNALGHGGEGVTLNHYIEPGSVQRGNTKAISERLDRSPDPSQEIVPD